MKSVRPASLVPRWWPGVVGGVGGDESGLKEIRPGYYPLPLASKMCVTKESGSCIWGEKSAYFLVWTGTSTGPTLVMDAPVFIEAKCFAVKNVMRLFLRASPIVLCCCCASNAAPSRFRTFFFLPFRSVFVSVDRWFWEEPFLANG